MKLAAAALIAVTGLFATVPASAHTDVGIGLSIGVPGLGVSYYEPAYRPRYYAPAPVYYAPPPVYYAPPRRAYYAPRYVAPRPVYYAPSYNVVYRGGRPWCNDHNGWHDHGRPSSNYGGGGGNYGRGNHNYNDDYRDHQHDNGHRDNGWRYKN